MGGLRVRSRWTVFVERIYGIFRICGIRSRKGGTTKEERPRDAFVKRPRPSVFVADPSDPEVISTGECNR
jgi:hypothetical protein